VGEEEEEEEVDDEVDEEGGNKGKDKTVSLLSFFLLVPFLKTYYYFPS
jgi:hypothetical protein